MYATIQQLIRLGVTVLLLSFLATPAAAQSDQNPCPVVPSEFIDLEKLLTNIQQLGVALGLVIASLGYTAAGLLWMRMTAEAQRLAKEVFKNTSIGLVLVLISTGLVEYIKDILGCGGA